MGIFSGLVNFFRRPAVKKVDPVEFNRRVRSTPSAVNEEGYVSQPVPLRPIGGSSAIRPTQQPIYHSHTFPAYQQAPQPASNNSFLESVLIAEATDSALAGAVLGGDPLGAFIGMEIAEERREERREEIREEIREERIEEQRYEREEPRYETYRDDTPSYQSDPTPSYDSSNNVDDYNGGDDNSGF